MLRDGLEILSRAILTAHKSRGICRECPHIEYTDRRQICHGGEFDCCKCEACKIARRVITA